MRLLLKWLVRRLICRLFLVKPRQLQRQPGGEPLTKLEWLAFRAVRYGIWCLLKSNAIIKWRHGSRSSASCFELAIFCCGAPKCNPAEESRRLDRGDRDCNCFFCHMQRSRSFTGRASNMPVNGTYFAPTCANTRPLPITVASASRMRHATKSASVRRRCRIITSRWD